MEHFEEMRSKALEYAKCYHKEVYQEFLKVQKGNATQKDITKQ